MSDYLLAISLRFEEIEKHSEESLMSNQRLSLSLLENIFKDFYEFGISGEAESLKTLEPTKAVITGVTKHLDWLQTFIGVYARSEIIFDEYSSDIAVYKVRSGIEFLLTDFRNQSAAFDKILTEFKTCSCLEDEFDHILRNWIDSGCSYTLRAEEIPKTIPSSHWWWK